MSEEKRVNHLWGCAKELSTETHAERLLKSYYINLSRKLARHNMQLPEESIGPARICARCGSQWSDGHYKLHLQPQQLASNAKRRRLIAQLEAVKAKEQRGVLSTGARKRAKWLKKRMTSNVAVDCELCGHQTKLPLEKPKKRTKPKTMEPPKALPTQTTTKTTVKSKLKAKNKNKDVNAGLKLPMPSQPQPQKKQQKQPAAAAAAATTPAKPPKATATTTTKAGNKQKKKQSKAAPTPAVQKVQSKTQKQNALLQLAAQLKSHASQNASRTQQNRLQSFLK